MMFANMKNTENACRPRFQHRIAFINRLMEITCLFSTVESDATAGALGGLRAFSELMWNRCPISERLSTPHK